jgi:NAD-dependent dihydropyrimidine dehydrogenase PreA subunit
MAYVIVGSCINDAACVAVCPVDCIRPTPDAPGFPGAEMLYIDADVCIDCHACAEACPIDAIFPANRLPARWAAYQEINAAYFRREHPRED